MIQGWTKEDEAYLASHRGIFSIDKMAAELGRSYKSVSNKLYRLRPEVKAFIERSITYPSRPPHFFSEDHMPATFEEAAEKLNCLIGYHRSRKPSPQSVNLKQYTVLVIPCLHIPFHSEKNLAEILYMEKEEPAMVDELVLAGDFLDCLSVSHAGYQRNIRPHLYATLTEELAIGKAVISELAQTFPKITIMRGNHLDRVRKYFADRIPPELMFLVQYDILKLLTTDFPNIHHVNTVDKYENDLGWIYQVGDVRICHAELGSSIELRPTIKLDKWFAEWDDHFRNVTSLTPYRALIECHTHQAGFFYANSGSRVLVEGGSLCREPQYAMEPKIPYSRPQTNAVTYFILKEDKKVDINSIWQHVFERME